MSADFWQWLAILALFVLQLVYAHLTHKCFEAVIDCVKAIRAALGGKQLDGDNCS